ncbi:MAG TPA: zinc-ribbon domain-containing protein, partial [Polyangiales bacterium]|nr:zinc-ribbon domain-containing protein [Polyangiales bacterium]
MCAPSGRSRAGVRPRATRNERDEAARCARGGCDRMDVICTRCSTSYEFEEGLVSTTGTTVKCTNCGHLFKVHRGSETATLPDPPAELRWRVRRTDGSVHTLQSLADLTPLITAGQFRRDDELSRTGQVWRRLGEVAEWAPLFEGGRARLRSDPPTLVAPTLSPPPPMPSERGAGDSRRISDPPPAGEASAVAARSRRQSGFEAMGVAVDLMTPPSPPPVRAAAGERSSVPLPPRASEPARVPLPKPAAAHTPSPAP